jgi:hypothetical protein
VLSSLEPVTSALHAGDVVHRGEVIGILEAGHCGASPCLHLGARIDGRYANPLLFLGGVPHAVLYPTRTIARARPPARDSARAVRRRADGGGDAADGGRPGRDDAQARGWAVAYADLRRSAETCV